MPALNKNITVRLRADASNFNASIKAAGANAQQLAAGMEQSGRKTSLLTTGLAAAGMAAGALGVAAIKTASDFDASMSGVQSATRASAAEMDLLRQAAIDAGADTIYSASEAAAGITELGKAGLSTTDILSGGLSGALDLAASEGIDVSEAAELMATALTQFGLSGDRATDVADALAAGAGSASGSARDLGFALSQAGTMAHTYGISMEETVGALSAFASAGMIGSDAGTSLRSMLQHLGNPTDEAKTLMDELGISVYDSSGHFVSLANLAGQLQTQMGGLSEEERNAAMATIFGADAVRAATQLYNQGAAGVEKWTKTVSQSGYAADMASTRTDNLQGDLEQLSGSFETLLINLGEGGQGPLRALVQTLDTLVDAFSSLPAPVQQTIVLGTALAGGVVALHKAMAPLNSSASGVAKSFGLMLDPWQRVMTALPQLKSGFQQLGQAAAGTDPGMGLMNNGLTRGQTAMNGLKGIANGVISLMGGPWGVAFTIAGAALLGWANQAKEAKQRADEIKNAFLTTGDATQALVDSIQNMELGDNNGLPEWLDRINTGAKDVPDLLDQVGLSITDLALAAQGDEDALARYNEKLDELADGHGRSVAQANALRQALDTATDAYNDGSKAAQDNKQAVEEVNQVNGTASDSTDALADSTSDAADAAEEYNDELKDLIDNLFALEQSRLSADQSVVALNQEILDLNETVSANGAVLDANGNALAGYEEKAYGTQDSLYSLASQAQDTATKILEEGQATGDMAAATEQARGVLEQARQAFINNAVASGMNQEAAAALADQLGLTGSKADALAQSINSIPNGKTVPFATPGLDDAIVKSMTLKDKLAALQSKTITITQVMRTEFQTLTGAPSKVNQYGPLKSGYRAEGGLIGYANGGLLSLANGDGYSGLIHGWGGKKADVVPIMASRGEFMQQASAVDYYGVDAMRALNERKIPREWLAGPQQNVTPKIEQSNVTNNYYATYNFPSITPIEVKRTRELTKTAQLGTM